MLVRYRFVTGEVSDVEVSTELGGVLLDLGRQEYNNEHRETRRHVSLDERPDAGAWLATDSGVDEMAKQTEAIDRLRAAVDQLTDKQRELITALYLSENPISQAEYGAQQGIAEHSVKQGALRARKKLREILERMYT